jgi:cytoskeletal protein CcmA (bactofilin family)
VGGGRGGNRCYTARSRPTTGALARRLGCPGGNLRAAGRLDALRRRHHDAGVNIKLKDVEISDSDVMVIEGHVEATVHRHVMEIAKPGTLKGTAMIGVAEIHGEFSGELTAHTRLVVHGTGRVSGTIRYGKLIVAEGGEIHGDVRQLDAADASTPPGTHRAAGRAVRAGDVRLARAAPTRRRAGWRRGRTRGRGTLDDGQ